MARKAVRTDAEQGRSFNVKVDFYKSAARADGVRLESTLAKAMALPQNSRTLTVDKERIILIYISENSGRFEGEIARLRMTETPVIGDMRGHLEDIPLRPDQGIAERTAFLFDADTQILAIHAVREAVSASRLAGYCDNVEASQNGFVFEPLVSTSTIGDFNRLAAIRKVEIKIASVGAAASAPAQDRASVKDYLRLRQFAGLEAETMTITLGMGMHRNGGMVRDAARGLIRGLLDHRVSLSVETLRVSGKDAGDEAVLLDLLQGRVREEVQIRVKGRSASYNQRAGAVSKAFESNLELF
jgi:hypothetical protein